MKKLVKKAKKMMEDKGIMPTHLIINTKDYKTFLKPKLTFMGMDIVVDGTLKKNQVFLIDKNQIRIDYTFGKEKKKSLWTKIKERIRAIWYVIKYGDD